MLLHYNRNHHYYRFWSYDFWRNSISIKKNICNWYSISNWKTMWNIELSGEYQRAGPVEWYLKYEYFIGKVFKLPLSVLNLDENSISLRSISWTLSKWTEISISHCWKLLQIDNSILRTCINQTCLHKYWTNDLLIMMSAFTWPRIIHKELYYNSIQRVW